MESENYSQGKPLRILILELLNSEGAAHYKEIILHVQNIRKDIKKHSVRARLSEGVLRKELARLDTGIYDIYQENENLTSVVSYPERGPWGNHRYRGNCSGFLIKDLILRFKAKRVFDPMEGSGTTREVVNGLNKFKKTKIEYAGGDLKTNGFNLLKDDIKGKYDFIFFHPPYQDIIKYSEYGDDLSNIDDYEEFVHKLKLCMKKLRNCLTPDGIIAVLIGDKRKNGKYTPIFNEILNFKIGTLKNVIIKLQHNVNSSNKNYSFRDNSNKKFFIPIAHEYVLIFQVLKLKCRIKNCNNESVPDHLECGKCMDLLQETMEMEDEFRRKYSV